MVYFEKNSKSKYVIMENCLRMCGQGLRKNNAMLLEYNQPGGAAKAQWIHLLLLSCRPGFKSQPQLLP